MTLVYFLLITAILAVLIVALEPLEIRIRANRRRKREAQFARDLGAYLAPLIREQIEQRAREIAETRQTFAIPAPVRGPNGRFVKRGA